ncbi:radical SAM family heme chaperone HemW [Dysgonomonas sp. OttesenSCG-928-M03]|nr:radical SAM family heme chaperone HemW [Dysgonomonas sp. OttesenSCG-928-M03]
MAGIYIHIPFCKTRCVYCDFYTRTDLSKKSPYLDALCKEIGLVKDYLDGEVIKTIYLGGGTPSQLSINELQIILSTLSDNFTINDDSEITLEANPDDLNEEYVSALLDLGFNRLSMGIQSFNDTHLKYLNRRHSAQKAIDAVKTSQQAGFKNISIDLIYGLPQQTMLDWTESLNKAIDLNIQHISSYHLIYEEGTKLCRLLNSGKVKPVDEDTSLDMFSLMIDKLSEAGFIHYEISNFGKDRYFSRHNSSYWLDQKYLGLGPSAHSYNKTHRRLNVPSIAKYINGIESGSPEIEIERLDIDTRYNDFVLTGMRTMWGISAEKLMRQFGKKYLFYFEKNIQKHIQAQTVILINDTYKLTRKGIFISDSIMSDLMYIK